MTSIKQETASQTAGPYVHIGCTPNFSGVDDIYREDLGSKINFPSGNGEEIVIKGIIFDGDGNPLLDAMVEIWQADSNGQYNQKSDDTYGWGRCACDMKSGEFSFKTIKPGSVDYDCIKQAPHISFFIIARGINKGLHTRMYFADEVAKNSADPLLMHIKDEAKISTLIAKPVESGKYQFDIHLQGNQETVFLDI